MLPVTSVLYHNIAEAETPFEAGLGLTTRPDVFESHIKYFEKNYDVVDLDTLISGKLPRRPLFITFDDCYQSVVTAAEAVLAPRGLPSVFFVNPSLVGGGISLDNLLAWAYNRHGAAAVCAVFDLSPETYPTAAVFIRDVLSSRTSAQRDEVRHRLLEAFPVPDAELATRSPMLQATDFERLRRAGVQIGNHTNHHVHCGALDPDEYEDELLAAQAQLAELSGGPVRAFSVAYGGERDLPPPVLKTLRDSGHEAIFLVHARSNLVKKAPDIWYRVSFENETIGSMPMRLSILPLARTFRDLLRK